jgi:hypothetical protein
MYCLIKEYPEKVQDDQTINLLKMCIKCAHFWSKIDNEEEASKLYLIAFQLEKKLEFTLNTKELALCSFNLKIDHAKMEWKLKQDSSAFFILSKAKEKLAEHLGPVEIKKYVKTCFELGKLSVNPTDALKWYRYALNLIENVSPQLFLNEPIKVLKI